MGVVDSRVQQFSKSKGDRELEGSTLAVSISSDLDMGCNTYSDAIFHILWKTGAFDCGGGCGGSKSSTGPMGA